MRIFAQILALSAMGIRTLPNRLGSSTVVVVGITGVVTVLISVLAMSRGFVHALQATAMEDRAIVVRTGASGELTSLLSYEATRVIANAAGIKKGVNGITLVSPEALTSINLRKSDGTDGDAPLRGLMPWGLAVHPEIRLLEGRSYQEGLPELMVGRAAQRLFRGLRPGSQLTFGGTTWTIVGVFESAGSARESELITDARMLNSVFQRENIFQSVLVILESPASFAAFKSSVTTNPQLQVDSFRERDFRTQQSERIDSLLADLAYVVGGIMAAGAMFGALNSMYSAVSARSREIATLRAIGFGPLPVLVSIVGEALLLACVGGVLGIALAWGLFNGYSVNTAGGGLGGQVVFDLAVTFNLSMIGFAWAAVIGLVGGLFPAVRGARLTIAAALRAL